MDHTPRFTHDCSDCSFIGQLIDYDIYTCPQGGMPTVIARWGNDGPEYTSGPELTLHGINLVTDIEPWHLRQTWLQLQASVVHEINKVAGDIIDEPMVRMALATRAFARVHHMYQMNLLSLLDDEPTMADARRVVDDNLYGSVYG